jgi:DNA repair protein RecO
MHLETLNLIDFEVIQGRAWPIISSAVMLKSHAKVRESLPKLAAVQFFTEVLDKIAFENEQDSHLWEFLSALLADFNEISDQKLLSLFRQKQADFLKVLGYAPQIERCVVCSADALSGPEKMAALSTELGGILCANCFLSGGRGILIEKQDLGLLSGQLKGEQAPRYSALDEFFEYTVGRKLSSLSFLYSVLR